MDEDEDAKGDVRFPIDLMIASHMKLPSIEFDEQHRNL